jgi:hypothetical protein
MYRLYVILGDDYLSTSISINGQYSATINSAIKFKSDLSNRGTQYFVSVYVLWLTIPTWAQFIHKVSMYQQRSLPFVNRGVTHVVTTDSTDRIMLACCIIYDYCCNNHPERQLRHTRHSFAFGHAISVQWLFHPVNSYACERDLRRGCLMATHTDLFVQWWRCYIMRTCMRWNN